MTPERTAATDAAINTHSPPGRTDSRSGPKGNQDLFGTILDNHQARTAPAEGHKEKGAGKSAAKDSDADRDSQVSGHGSPVSGNDPDSDQAPVAEKPAAPAANGDAVLAAAAAVALTAAPAVVAQPATAAGAAAAQAPVVPQPVVQLPVDAKPAVAVPASAAPAVPVAAVPAPAAPAAPAAQAAPAVPVVDAQPPVAKPVLAGQPAQPQAPQAQVPVPTGAKPQSDAQTPGQGQPQQQPAQAQAQAPMQQVAPTGPVAAAQPVADAAAAPAQPAKPAEGAAQVQAQQSQPQPTDPAGVQAPAAQPTPPTAPQAGPIEANRFEPAPGMRLQQAVETVQAVVRMAQTNGVTRARVALHPEQLGGVEIHLSSTKDGVTARVVADAAQAANVLRHAGEELRRSLESQGINLVRFDVGTAGGQQERRSDFGQEPGSGSNGRTPTDSMEETEVTSDTTQERTVQLPNGVLVDVLA
ncbi:MAG TPA: flagellar hook-length control protein FliK [Thermoleophilaceae bacterium]|nr:flagellar hook-length control protein FliK [Thermoleophilaceae bacterium]